MIRFVIFALIVAAIIAFFGKFIYIKLKKYIDKFNNDFEDEYLDLEVLNKKRQLEREKKRGITK